MADKFTKFHGTVESPAINSQAITPTDNTPLANTARAIYVGVTGNLNIQLIGDVANTILQAVPAGSLLPIRVNIINATGTTANGIVAFW